MTELTLKEDGWALTYHYTFFIVDHTDHRSLFVVDHANDAQKQYDFTRVVKAAKAQLVLDNKGKLEYVSFSLTDEHADEFLSFFTNATKTDNTPHTTA